MNSSMLTPFIQQKTEILVPKWSALLVAIPLLALVLSAAHAEVPFDPPGTYSTSWLGNSYLDVIGKKNVPEQAEDITVSPNGKVFTAGYHEAFGGGASYNASDGSFAGRYDGFDSGFGSPVKSVAADNNYVYFGCPGQGIKRFKQGEAAARTEIGSPARRLLACL